MKNAPDCSGGIPNEHLTRREFCYKSIAVGGAALLGSTAACAQSTPPISSSSSRPDVASIDHDRILAAAENALSTPPPPLTSLPCPQSPGTVHDYYSERVPDSDASTNVPSPPPFMAHRDAVFKVGLVVPALAAAYHLTREERFAEHAALHLRAWFVDPATRMTPALNFAQVLPTPPRTNRTSGRSATGRYEGIIEALPLVEVAQSIPFLAASATITDSDLAAVREWFASYFTWLTAPEDSGPRFPALARDSKDHHGTSWLLQASACAYLAAPTGDVGRAEDTALSQLRQQFRHVTLRAQFAPNGTFPHELTSATPYRNSLFNLDMMACICQLLSTRFESVWDYQLEDGPSMRGAIAYHFPFIANRNIWPFRADADHFDELPGRRPALLLSARAYQRPEYAALWKTLRPDPSSPEILRSIPIHQPLLWVQQPGHRA